MTKYELLKDESGAWKSHSVIGIFHTDGANLILLDAKTIGNSGDRLEALRCAMLGPLGPQAEPPNKPTPKPTAATPKTSLRDRKKELRKRKRR